MTIVYDAAQSIKKIDGILKEHNPQSILFLHGNTSYELSGAKAAIEPQLGPYRITHYSGLAKSPTLEDVQSVVSAINDNKVDFVIAVGGGTVMDAAKAATALYNKSEDLATCVKKNDCSTRDITSMLIPTTSGTGAEITPFAVVYIDNVKYSLAHHSMKPDYVILAPELTYSLDAYTTAHTGCDALAQAIEGFWSVNAKAESQEFSRKAIPLLLQNIARAVKEPKNHDVRHAMMIGAHLAGESIARAKTTAAHALSYPMTAFHNIAHGHAVMLTLPYFFPINASATENNIQKETTTMRVKTDMASLYQLLHVSNAQGAQDLLLRMMDTIGLPRKLSEIGISADAIPNIVAHGFNPQRVKNNPVVVTEDMETQILKQIL